MIDERANQNNSVRRKIEAFSTTMTLPTVRRALGVIEGEHASRRRGGNDDLLDIRPYDTGDEARAIDWKISARSGQPMVVQRERLVSGRVYLLTDVGREMNEYCASGERAYEVAANALCMVAALSLRRSDDVSLVFADNASITRVPFHGGFAHFERVLDKALDRQWDAPRNVAALLDYAARIRDRNAFVVIATDSHGLDPDHIKRLRRIAQTHPCMVIDVSTINPFERHPIESMPDAAITDAHTHRRVPALLRTKRNAEAVSTHDAYAIAALERELTRCGTQFIHAPSSEAMLHAFLTLISRAQQGAYAYRPAPQPASVDAPGGNQ